MKRVAGAGLVAALLVALMFAQIPRPAFAYPNTDTTDAQQCTCAEGNCASKVPGREMSHQEVTRHVGKVLALKNTKEIRKLLPAGATFRPEEARGLDLGQGRMLVFIPAKLKDGSLAGFTSAALENGKVVADYGAVHQDNVVKFLVRGDVVKEVVPEIAHEGEMSAQKANWGCAIPCGLGCALSYCLIPGWGQVTCFICGTVFCTWVCG